MGGVAATQTLTLIVRGLALGQVERANSRWLLGKEVAVDVRRVRFWIEARGLDQHLDNKQRGSR